MSYTISPRELRAKLSTVADLRIAQARMAGMDAKADPMDIADETVKRAIRATGKRPGGYNYAAGVLTYTDWGIKINRAGEIDWGGFVFQRAAE